MNEQPVQHAALDASFFQPILDNGQQILATASEDPRYWFAHIVTWLLIAKLKLWWDHLPESKADRLTETMATLVCFVLSLWVFWESEYLWQISLVNGLINTYFYKGVVIALDITGLKGIAGRLKGSSYKVSNKPVHEEAVERGEELSDEELEQTVFLYREGDGKTIKIRKDKMGQYKVKQ